MRTILTLIASLLVVGAATAQDFNLRSGQEVRVRLLTAVSSSKNLQATPTAIVDSNITDSEGNILISRGTNVELLVDAQHRKGLGKAGFIKLDCLKTTAVDGQPIYLMGGVAASGKDREGLAIGLGVGGGIVVFPVGFFCLCIKGEDAYIPSNTILSNIVIDDNYRVRVSGAN